MNKYLATLIFYTVACTIIVLLYRISPDAQDGGPGVGSLAIILMLLIVVGLIGFNIYRGLKINKEYFIIAAIHAVLLIVGVFRFFI